MPDTTPEKLANQLIGQTVVGLMIDYDAEIITLQLSEGDIDFDANTLTMTYYKLENSKLN